MRAISLDRKILPRHTSAHTPQNDFALLCRLQIPEPKPNDSRFALICLCFMCPTNVWLWGVGVIEFQIITRPVEIAIS